jgi:hypothetical protein
VLLSQASVPILSVLPLFPPTSESPYTGTQATGAARASLQRALDNYKTGHITLQQHNEGSDLSRSDTRSFGESHAHELSNINTDLAQSGQPGIPVTPPALQKPSAQSAPAQPNATSPQANITSPPINPSNLNLSPAPIPQASPSVAHPSVTSPSPVIAPDPEKPGIKLPAITPTLAETGVPVTAGKSGPGPSSGSLHDIKGTKSPPAQSTPLRNSASGNQTWESAEDEKKRLAASYSPALVGADPPPPKSSEQLESADEEKKRLEREERERLLRDGAVGGSNEDTSKKPGEDDLPPYQDI